MKRRKALPYFLASLVFGVLAVTVLPTPFGGFAALACFAAFFTGGARVLENSDPETVRKMTRGGIVGGGGF